MRLKNLKNEAFSLLEVLLASIIFIISVAGIFVTLTAVRGPVANKENQLAASTFGKQVLQALYSEVSASSVSTPYYGTCSSSPCPVFDLTVAAHNVSPAILSSQGGLTWPSASLAALNVCASIPSGCLVYTVTCADNGATSPPCSSINIAHKVVLNIVWQ